jgi:hypothetical protein
MKKIQIVLLQSTLDLLVLKTLKPRPTHCWNTMQLHPVRGYPIFRSSLILQDLKNHSDFYKPCKIKEERKIG